MQMLSAGKIGKEQVKRTRSWLYFWLVKKVARYFQPIVCKRFLPFFTTPSRCFWLLFLVCSQNGQKRLLRRLQSKVNCFKNLTHFWPHRIPPSCTNKLTINCSMLQRRLKFHCFTLRRRKMRLEQFSVGSSFTLHLIQVYVKQAN